MEREEKREKSKGDKKSIQVRVESRLKVESSGKHVGFEIDVAQRLHCVVLHGAIVVAIVF